jgi:DNA-binding NarL/FixJ family response regulator
MVVDVSATTQNLRIRTLVVDDSPVMRSAICRLLETTCEVEVVGTASDGSVALDLAERLCPDIVLMDIMLPGMNGIEAATHIKSLIPGVKILMLSMYEDSAYQSDAGSAGAVGYVPKRRMGVELIPAVTKLLCETVKR